VNDAAKKKILARRARFVAAAVASVGMACGKSSEQPHPCLSVEYVPDAETPPMPCLSVAYVPPADAGDGAATDAGTDDGGTTDGGATKAQAQVKDAGATKPPKPQPTPTPMPCLTPLPPRKDPTR
jgi:hypothetical protein